MQLSYHINYKICPSLFSHSKTKINKLLSTIVSIPLARVEIRKDNMYNENFTVVVFLLEKNCISSLKGTGKSLTSAIHKLSNKVDQYNKNQAFVNAFTKKVVAA